MKASRLTGITAVLLSVFFFYLSSLPIRWARVYGTLGGAEFIYARFLLGSFVICFIQLLKGSFPRADRPMILAGRVIFHFTACWLYYVSIELSNAALGNVLHMTYPLFAALILCIGGKSDAPLRDLGLSAISVFGIALTCDLSGSFQATSFGILSGVSGAASVILLSTSRQGNSTFDVFFYTFLGCLALSVIVARPEFHISTSEELWYLILSAALGVAGQFCFTYGAAFIAAVESSILSCLRIPLALIGAVVGLENTAVTVQAWIGAFLVFTANLAVIYKRNQKLKTPPVEITVS